MNTFNYNQIVKDIIEDVFSYSIDESFMAEYEIPRPDNAKVLIDILTQKMAEMANKKWYLLNKGDNWVIYHHKEEMLMFFIDIYDKKVVVMRLRNSERLCMSREIKKLIK